MNGSMWIYLFLLCSGWVVCTCSEVDDDDDMLLAYSVRLVSVSAFW